MPNHEDLTMGDVKKLLDDMRQTCDALSDAIGFLGSITETQIGRDADRILEGTARLLPPPPRLPYISPSLCTHLVESE